MGCEIWGIGFEMRDMGYGIRVTRYVMRDRRYAIRDMGYEMLDAGFGIFCRKKENPFGMRIAPCLESNRNMINELQKTSYLAIG